MTSSRSSGSRSRLLAALVVLAAALGLGGVAQAGRKRVVVLDFEGPRADRFHDDVVKLIQKAHTVVPTDKWNGTAEELDAGAVSDRNFKKVARKLKIDAVIEGKIEKRRDDFIIRIKLHAGKTGELFGSPIGTKATGPRIDGKAQRELNDELLEAIGNVESNHGGGAADDDDRPAKKPAKPADDDDDRPVKKSARKTDDDDRPARKSAKRAEDDDRPAKKSAKKPGFSRHTDDERGNDRVAGRSAKPDDDDQPANKSAKADDDRPAKKSAKQTDDDELPARKPTRTDDDKPRAKRSQAADDETDEDAPKQPRKRVAARDDDGVEAEASAPLDAATALAPAERAIDAVVGMSVTARRLSFTTRPGLTTLPRGYKGDPAGGGLLDATFYPLAFGHTRRDHGKDLGIHAMYDRVVGLGSKLVAADGTVQSLDTKQSRWSIGGVFRYAIGGSTAAPIVGATLDYGKQLFRLSGTAEIPSVAYSIIEPGVLVRLPLGKLTLALDAGLLVITDTGQLQDQMHYGTTSLLGYEGAVSADYAITRTLFVRAAFRYETIGLQFLGNGKLTTTLDGDPTTADVTAGRDSYIGGLLTAGYAY